VADDDRRFFDMAQVYFRFQPEQIVQDPRRHVAHIRGTLTQIIIFDCGKGGGVALGHAVKSMLRVHLVVLNRPHDFIQERAILQHQQMGVENARFLRAHRRHHLVLHRLNLGARFRNGALESIDLLRNFRFSHRPLSGRWTAAPNHEHLSAAYSGRNRNAPKCPLSVARSFGHGG
jgi:hypothetical protein